MVIHRPCWKVLYKLPADLAKFLAFEALKSTGPDVDVESAMAVGYHGGAPFKDS